MCVLAEVDVPSHVVAAALDDPEAMGKVAHLGYVQRDLEIVEHTHLVLVGGDLSGNRVRLLENGGGLDASSLYALM